MATTGWSALLSFIAETSAPSFLSLLSQRIYFLTHLVVVHKHFSILHCVELVVISWYDGVYQSAFTAEELSTGT